MTSGANITMGADLIRKERGETAFALTSPLVLKTDGTKFGKTESGGVFLAKERTSPFAFYQFFWRSEDVMTPIYLRYFTFLDHDEIRSLDEAIAELGHKRRAAQRKLAHEICALVHGEQETIQVEHAVAALYSEDLAGLDEATLLMALDDAPTTVIARSALDGDGVDLVEVLVSTGLREVEEGGSRRDRTRWRLHQQSARRYRRYACEPRRSPARPLRRPATRSARAAPVALCLSDRRVVGLPARW